MKNLTILYNGKSVEAEDKITVAAFLDHNGYGKKRTSVWLDGRQLLTSEYQTVELTQGCTIKVVRILGGG
ncbi:MAG: sulfur carrier protein ThiS [Oscillospiraceae bacterium]|nr:sulfur carrier protein ThiS [Oscillospiraceae bacterium]